MIRPRISIALATYNGDRFLREQLRSLASQTCVPFELVVSDDGSSDGSMEILEAFAGTAPFEVAIHASREHLGFGDNFLRAASLCSGEWIAFCDQDDVWLPYKLERCADLIARLPKVDLLSHSAMRTDEVLNRLPGCFPDHGKVTVTGPLGNKPLSVLPGFSLLVRRSLFDLVDYSDRPRSLSGTGDLQTHDWFVCNIANAYGHTVRIPDRLVLYRRHGQSVSGDPATRVPWRNLWATTVRNRSEHGRLLAQRAVYAREHRDFYDRLLGGARPGGSPDEFTSRTRQARRYFERVGVAYSTRAEIYARDRPVGHRIAALVRAARMGSYGRISDGRGFGAGAFAKDFVSAILSR